MLVSVIIPTIKPDTALLPLITELNEKAWSFQLIVQSNPNSPGCAWNMNRGLECAAGDYIVKIDDDISGLPLHWDRLLTYPLQDPSIMVVAPRLKFPNGQYQMTCTHELEMEGEMADSPRKVVPFCCCAFRNDGTRFDENFKGTWCDDADFCAQLRMKRADARFVTLNTMSVTHRNEGKGRHAEENGAYFGKKWGNVVFPDGKGLL